MTTHRIITGDVLAGLATLPDGCVHTVVTSPPYYGLRDYGIDGQIGLEETPEAYIARMVAVFRGVRRVLRDDGSAWVNMGDSYASNGSRRVDEQERKSGVIRAEQKGYDVGGWSGSDHIDRAAVPCPAGMKPKDLMGIPWALAQALRAPYYTGKIRDERERIWLSAMIEAEGCMFIHRRKEGQNNGQGYERKHDSFGAGLEVASTDLAIVERCKAITGLGSICSQSPEQNNRRKLTIYRWNLRSNVCREVIREVYPYMVAKQHEARLLLGCPSSGTKAEQAWQAIKALHQGGHPEIDFPPPASLYEPGWYLRSEIIWSKSNPMPESVTDRPTKAHEQIFLLSKSAKYHYDAEAVREPGGPWSKMPDGWDTGEGAHGSFHREGREKGRRSGNKVRTPGEDRIPGASHVGRGFPWEDSGQGRNRRTVWTVATAPFKDAHFATFPPKLIEPCILAGCPAKSCPVCGAPWERVVEPSPEYKERLEETGESWYQRRDNPHGEKKSGKHDAGICAQYVTLGFRPTCDHDAEPVPGTVLDPFMGAGTTAVVAKSLGRNSIGCELNPKYVAMAERRTAATECQGVLELAL